MTSLVGWAGELALLWLVAVAVMLAVMLAVVLAAVLAVVLGDGACDAPPASPSLYQEQEAGENHV